MDGSWERLVESVKNVMYKIKPNPIPPDELLHNMFVEIEVMVNAKPLTYIPIKDENNEALTSNHFLLRSSNGNKPIGDFTNEKTILERI